MPHDSAESMLFTLFDNINFRCILFAMPTNFNRQFTAVGGVSLTQKQAREIFDLFRKMGKLLDADRRVRPLTKAEFYLMNMLYDGKPANVTVLANRLRVSKTTVSKLIHCVEGKGYVQRITDSNDRRITYIQLTEQGKTLTRSCILSHKKSLVDMVDRIGEEDTNELIRIMNKIVEKGEKA